MFRYADKPVGPPDQEESEPSHHERRPASILPLEFPVRSTLVMNIKKGRCGAGHIKDKKDKSLNFYDRD